MPNPTNSEHEVFECYFCSQEHGRPREESRVMRTGELVCERCADEQCIVCDYCEELVDPDDTFYIHGEGRYCDHCTDHHSAECNRCEDLFPNDALIEHNGRNLCPGCMDRPSLNPTENTDFQSKDKGKIVKSPRRFGIELEAVYKEGDAVAKLHGEHPRWGYSTDGSIRGHKDAMGARELVSPIMSGKAGEKEIQAFTGKARAYGFLVNASCGFHLHLEAIDFKRDPKKDETVEKEVGEQKVYVWTHPNSGRTERTSWIPRMEDDTVIPHTVETKPIIETYKVNKGGSFYKLRDLFYTYVAFDDVFRGMQPPSRRDNRFCKATSVLYGLDKIRELDDFSDLERLWYKVNRRNRIYTQIMEAEDRKRGKDGSRYVGFNLEPILRHGSQTIELRYHSPTLNAEKILRWIDIHQTIFDFVATQEFPEEAINSVLAKETNLLSKAKAMCQIFKIRKETEEYIMARLHKFNQLGKLEEDEEVHDSPIGTPAFRDRGELMERPRRGTNSAIEALFTYEMALQQSQRANRQNPVYPLQITTDEDFTN